MDNLITSALRVFGASGTCSCIDTSLFGQICSDGSGKEIFMILSLAINVMSVGVAVLAAVGIAVFGIQWLTSKGDPAKLTKAKSRLFNVVTGLVVYVLLYTVLEFLIPGGVFDLNSVDYENCTPTAPSNSGGGSSGSGGSGGETNPTPPSTTFNRLCGPEEPGALGQISEMKIKNTADGATMPAAGFDRYLTRKYTTLRGRVYYIFVQQNKVWANESAGHGTTMANNGCRITSRATILRSYGAEVTPKNVSSKEESWWLAQSPTSQLSIKVSSYYYDSTNPNEYMNKIWNTLQKGGAVIIQATMTAGSQSSFFFKPKCHPGKNCQHNMSIVDWRLNSNGDKEVYFLDTRPSTNQNNVVGWHKLSDMLDDLKKRSTELNNYITMYTPQNQITCAH